MRVQHQVELPGKVPNVMQSGIHPLATERAVNVSGIACDEHTPHAELGRLAVMDAEIAAPVQGARFDSAGRAFSKYFPHKLKRWGVSLHVFDDRYDTAASAAD